MPNMCELDALLSGGVAGLGKVDLSPRTVLSTRRISDLRGALGQTEKKVKTKSKKSKSKPKKHPPGPNARRMLEIAEAQYAKGNRNLALAWGARAIKRAQSEGDKEVAQKAEELVKMIRGQEVLKALSGLGDVDGLVMGRLAGLW